MTADYLDPEMESESQAISNYEDELAEFINHYKGIKSYREELWNEYHVTIHYQEYEECYGFYIKDSCEYLWKLEDCLEKMYNYINVKDYEKACEENETPF